MEPTPQHFVFAVTSIPGSTVACAAHGDLAFFMLLAVHYAQIAAAAARAGGRLVKVMGSGTILTFPVERAHDAVVSLRELQVAGTILCQAFDERCRLQVKVGAGTLIAGSLGAPGHEQFDVIGNALNQLVKLPWADFVVTPEVDALLARRSAH
ncbi:MAG: adenylate/guanylate cyclase domain-containing protein [Gemmatimonadales bacterium]